MNAGLQRGSIAVVPGRTAVPSLPERVAVRRKYDVVRPAITPTQMAASRIAVPV
jgi:hypothetical protein